MTKNTTELLDSVMHRQLKIDIKNLDIPHNKVNWSFVTIGELHSLVHEYPIFITKNADTGQFQLSALLGFSSGQNLFIQNNKWQATYLPLDMLRRPFKAMLTKENDESSGRITIDTSSPAVTNSADGERLFDDEGKPTRYLERIQDTFAQLMGGTILSRKLLAIAYQHNLIESITINIELDNKPNVHLTGLYGVNKAALDALSGEALAECHQAGVLQVCHLLLSSGIHIEKLIKWAEAA